MTLFLVLLIGGFFIMFLALVGDFDKGEKRLVIGGIMVIASMIVMFHEVAKYSAEFKKNCEARSGHVMHLYRTSVCVSADGRIL